jgi:hypothetical protein
MLVNPDKMGITLVKVFTLEFVTLGILLVLVYLL